MKDRGDLRAAVEVDLIEDGTIVPTRECSILASVNDSRSVAGEEIRLLRAKLQRICKARALSCIALSSALPGEGKSTVAVGLAAALAREAKGRVLLVEADLRRPTISEALGLAPAPGLSEWLNDGLSRIPVRRIGHGGFFLLVAGQAPLSRPEALGTPAMEALLRAARRDFDFVLVDTPPVLSVADTILLQDLLDGFILVVRSRLTPRDAIVEAVGRLDPGKVLGLVLNDHREYRHSYASYAYERYGMTYGASPWSGDRKSQASRSPVQPRAPSAPRRR
jgi:capsular exopolysaccharide synthesis family protein